MAIEFKDGKYVDPQTGRVTLDPTQYKDWQIAEEAEKNLPSVDYFREKLGLLPEEIIPYGKTPKIDFIKVMNRLKDKPDGKFIEVTAITPTPFGEGKSTVSLGLIEGLGKLGLNVGGALERQGHCCRRRQRASDADDRVLPGSDRRYQRYHERAQPGDGRAERPYAA